MRAVALVLLLVASVRAVVVTRYLIEYSFFDNKPTAREDETDIVVFPDSVRLATVFDTAQSRTQLPLTVPSAGLPSMVPGGPPTASLRVRFGADEVRESDPRFFFSFCFFPSSPLPIYILFIYYCVINRLHTKKRLRTIRLACRRLAATVCALWPTSTFGSASRFACQRTCPHSTPIRLCSPSCATSPCLLCGVGHVVGWPRRPCF
jgi:hypothetical protein